MGKLKEQFDAMQKAAKTRRSGIQYGNWLPVSGEYLSKLNGEEYSVAKWGRDLDPELIKYGYIYLQWTIKNDIGRKSLADWRPGYEEFNEEIMEAFIEEYKDELFTGEYWDDELFKGTFNDK